MQDCLITYCFSFYFFSQIRLRTCAYLIYIRSHETKIRVLYIRSEVSLPPTNLNLEYDKNIVFI